MFIFGLHSTSDDWPSNLSKNIDRNARKTKKAPKSSKNKMFVFGLVQLLMISRAIRAKNIDQNIKI